MKTKTRVKYVIQYQGETYQGTPQEIAEKTNLSVHDIYMSRRENKKGGPHKSGIKYIKSFPFYSILLTDNVGITYRYSSFAEAGRATGYTSETLQEKYKNGKGMKGWKIERIENFEVVE